MARFRFANTVGDTVGLTVPLETAAEVSQARARRGALTALRRG